MDFCMILLATLGSRPIFDLMVIFMEYFSHENRLFRVDHETYLFIAFDCNPDGASGSLITVYC